MHKKKFKFKEEEGREDEGEAEWRNLELDAPEDKDMLRPRKCPERYPVAAEDYIHRESLSGNMVQR